MSKMKVNGYKCYVSLPAGRQVGGFKQDVEFTLKKLISKIKGTAKSTVIISQINF